MSSQATPNPVNPGPRIAEEVDIFALKELPAPPWLRRARPAVTAGSSVAGRAQAPSTTPQQQESVANVKEAPAASQPEFRGITCACDPCEDFIESYMQWADVLEAPVEMHEGVALSIIAAILNYNGVTIVNGSTPYTLDFWFLLLSGSGGGRSSMVRMPGVILSKAGLDFLPRREAWASVQAMYQHFADNPSGLHIWGEISEKLKELSDSRYGNAKAWLTDRYDETRPPENRTYRKTGREDKDGNSIDTPDIIFTRAPRTNLLATSSVAWFFRYLQQSDSAGGFVPRWMILSAKASNKLVPTPGPLDESLVMPMAARLREIARLQGPADLTEILPLYAQWYKDTNARFAKQNNSELALAYWNRHKVHALKLAVVYQASRYGNLKVCVDSWERAVAKARQLEDCIFGLLDTDMNHEGYKLKRMEDCVRNAGRRGLKLSEFTRAFKSDHFRDKELKTLVESERVDRFKLKPNGGRPAIVLVHSDFVQNYVDDYKAANNNAAPELV